MRIIIVGCGKVGSALAEHLSSEGHDLTLIDLSERRLEDLTTSLDVASVKGIGLPYHRARARSGICFRGRLYPR